MKNRRVDIPLTEDELEEYVREAQKKGFRRIDPTKKWSEKDRIEAFRFVVYCWHKNFMGSRKEICDF